MEVNDTLWRPLKEAAERKSATKIPSLEFLRSHNLRDPIREFVLNSQMISKYTFTLFETQASTPNALAN